MCSVIKKRNELIGMKMLLDIELAKEMTIISGFHINKKCVFLNMLATIFKVLIQKSSCQCIHHLVSRETVDVLTDSV